MILIKQMTVLFLIMMVGFICRKKGLLNEESSRKISGIVVNVANPALILSSGINPKDPMELSELIWVLGLSILIFAGLILVAVVFTFIPGISVKDRGLYQVMMIFSNIGFMGFPLVSAVYGQQALLMATMFVIPYNILIYTYGIHMMKKLPDRQNSDVSDEGMSNNKIEALTAEKPVAASIKKIFNIGVIACILTLVLYITRLPVPSVIEDTVDYLSSLTAPLSMMIIGDSMAKMHISELIDDWRLLVFAGTKLLLIPIAGLLLLKPWGISSDLLGVCMVMLATPVGSMTVMLAQQYGGDSELASKGVALTTVLSVATIPIVSLLV